MRRRVLFVVEGAFHDGRLGLLRDRGDVRVGWLARRRVVFEGDLLFLLLLLFLLWQEGLRWRLYRRRDNILMVHEVELGARTVNLAPQ